MKHYLLKGLSKKQHYFQQKTDSTNDSSGGSSGGSSGDSSGDSDGSLSSDDEEAVSKDIIYKLYNNRYYAIKYLGKGTFCRTWLMYDIQIHKCVAMKMFYPKYYDESLHELKIQNLIKHSNTRYVIILLNNFIYNNHNCLIYELMGTTLLDVLDYYNNNIPINIVKKILIQVFKGLDELHTNNIIHGDLKLENIMIKQHNKTIEHILEVLTTLELEKQYDTLIEDNIPKNYAEFDKNKKKNIKRKIKGRASKILGDTIKTKLESLTTGETIIDETFKLNENDIVCKIIDLGNSEILGINNDDEIMIRSYRPPENIMNNFYNEKADIWAMGCLSYELFTGDYLFDIDRDGDDNEKDRDHLHQMYEILGNIPKEYSMDCEFSNDLFDEHGSILNMNKCDYTTLESILITDYKLDEHSSNEITCFLKKQLDYNIKTRCSSKQLMDDEWLNN